MHEPDRCEGCGRPIAGGTPACRAEFDAVCASDYGGAVPYPLHRLTVDVYALQHPDAFMVSGKSYAAHLVGALVWFEHGGRADVQRAVRSWLDGARELERPRPPDDRGALTLEHVIAAGGGEAHAEALGRWAGSAWDAYAPQHALAQRWLAAALAARRERC